MRSLFDRTRPVSVQRLRVFLFLIGRGGASGHCRSDASGCSGSLLDSTGRWHYGVRSVLQHVRSMRELTELQPDVDTVASGQFCSASGRCFVVRSLCLTSASGRSQRVRSTQRARPVGASRHSRCAIGASGQCDQHVRSARLQRFQVRNSYI
jgi:hypothetical protein